MIRVLVTGSQGQLGKCIQKIVKDYPKINFIFKDSKALDITDMENVNEVFRSNNFDYCINCAAYTDVEQAEKTPKRAYAVNANGVRNLALACKENNMILIHISTDYVFDGEKDSPYTVDDTPNPINAYGKSKWEGERYVQEILDRYMIIRTSWLYSEFGKNFYTTILKKAKTEKALYVTDKQTGCPTNANNLANYILDQIVSDNKDYGVRHFTDGEAMTWYDFAVRILRKNSLESKVKLEKAKNYRTFAARPKYTVLKFK